MAPRGRIRASRERKGQARARGGARVQPVRPLQQVRRAHGRRRPPPVLRAPHRQVLPSGPRLVDASHIHALTSSSTHITHSSFVRTTPLFSDVHFIAHSHPHSAQHHQKRKQPHSAHPHHDG